MPKNPKTLPSNANQENLPAVIEQLEQMLTLIHTTVKDRLPRGDSMAAVCLLQGMKPAEWENFASTRDLEGWLGLPLHQDLATSLNTFIAGQERLTYQRDHDALTGLANRRFFYNRLEHEVERAIHSHSELTVMMLDLDNFKQINDTYGHPCGDKVLQKLGNLLQDSLRQYDLPGRVGGEEFAVLFPASSPWASSITANRLLEQFRAEQFACKGKKFQMTFSAGIAGLSSLEGTVTAEKLMAAADQALYDAKRQGKNRVTMSKEGKSLKDRASLVHSQEKQLLFACHNTSE